MTDAHELRHVCASLLIASGASDMQVAHQMGHSKVETTKNIYGHLFAQDRAAVLHALNQAVSRLHAYESKDPDTAARAQPLPSESAEWLSSPTSSRATAVAAVGAATL